MSAKSILKNYVARLSETELRGDAREESFYESLTDMLQEIAKESGRPDIQATTLPRHTDAGNPDFRVWNGNDSIVGYIEAKKPTEERLDYIESSEQLKRYLGTFDNLILTNFLEFRLYRKGELVDSVMLGRPAILNKVRHAPPVEKADELLNLLDMFFSFSQPKPFTADADLFARLAALGERLAELHLLKSPELNPPACRFEGEGDGRVEKGKKAGLRYDPDAERIYINAEQYFGPMPAEVWEYQVGGYQVCEKWLKDRRERRLELDDIRTYCRIVTALKLTIEIQSKIDEMYPAVEAETIEMA